MALQWIQDTVSALIKSMYKICCSLVVKSLTDANQWECQLCKHSIYKNKLVGGTMRKDGVSSIQFNTDSTSIWLV